ncbi:ribosome-binding factor A, partial [Clostridium perfringens]
LKSASGYIRKEIGQRINLRNTPQILFELDDSISYSMKIEELIEKAREK